MVAVGFVVGFSQSARSRCFGCLRRDETKGRLGPCDDIGNMIIPHDEVICL